MASKQTGDDSGETGERRGEQTGDGGLSYEYDRLNRLIRVNDSVLEITYVYEYDNNGNILCEKQYSYTLDEELSSLTPIDTIVYEYGNSSWTDQLTSYYGSEIEYDAMGNPLIYWDGSVLSWENGTRLKSIESPLGMVTYTYNDEGIRTSKTVNNTTHTYVLEGSRIISETYGNVVVVYLYDESNSPIGLAYKQGNDPFEQYFFTKNLQGDIMKIYTEGGELAVEYKYDAWGAIVDISYSSAYEKIAKANCLLYRGYYYDFETGYYYLNSRYYDPQVKRFISPDDVNYLGANDDMSAFNLYAYCSNNPVMYSDIRGNKWYDAFANLFVTIYDAIEAHAGIGFGLGGKINGLLKAEVSRDTGIVLDDGEFDGANFVSAKLTLVNEGSDITSLGYEAQTNHGHYVADNYFELCKEEITCERCRVKDKTFLMFTQKENGDLVVGVSVSAHVIIGGRAGIGLNLSEIKRNFIKDWNS